MLFSNVSAFAAGTDQSSVSDGTDVSTAVDDLESVYSNDGLSELIVLEEITELREANVKHFSLSNGLNKAVVYSQPVHYIDENGNWVDIDNSLTLQGNEYSANNKFEIKFANKSGSSGLLSIKDGSYKIDFTPLNTNKVSVVIENPQENNSRKFDDVKALRNLISKATYSNIYNGIDIEYILTGNNVKENITVNSVQDAYVYSFELELDKLTAELSNGSIILFDSTTGENMYIIPAPYMYDANGVISADVEYSLTQNNKWKYTFTVTADAEWINADERAFPVTIDPTIVADVADTDTFLTADNYNNYSSTSMIIGNFFDADIPGFIKFNTLPDIPTGSVLTNAKVAMYLNNVVNTNSIDFYLGIYKATQNWVNNSNLTYYTSSGFYASTPENSVKISGAGVYDKQWKNGTSNHGVCVKAVNLSASENTFAFISATESAPGYVPPQLELTYLDTKGVEDYYGLLNVSLGTSFESYVNLYNGSLTCINKLTAIGNQALPYEINMVYNSIDKEWIPSFNENIQLFDDCTDGIVRYVWTDADGTIHNFAPYLQKNSWGAYVQYEQSPPGDLWGVTDPTVFYPEDDIDYVLTKTTNGEFILKGYDGIQKFFDCEGKLTKICNSLGDMLYFYYIKQSYNESQSPRLSSIAYKSVNGTLTEQIRFEYKSSFNNKLCYIYNVQSQDEINISWSTTKRIDSISYNIENHASTENINFNYSTNGFLKIATDSVTQEKLDFSMYTSGKHIGISTFSNNIKEKEYTIQYNTSNTTVIDCGTNLESENDNFIYVIYQFDAKGRKLTATFGNEATNYTYDDSILPDNLYYSVLYHQNIFKEPFNSTDDAATYFAKKYYYSSYYIRHEYGATIYSVNHNNTRTYNFTNIGYGSVHRVRLYFNMTVGGDVEGDIHTHPFDSSYSGEDKIGDVGIGYLVIPNLSIKKFNYESQEEYESTISFSPNELTNTEKSLLCERFEISWQSHVSSDCDYLSDCDNHADEWPRELTP